MVKKIKKYKIAVRPHAVIRLAKKKLNLRDVTEEFEKKVGEEIARIQPFIVPQARYGSFSRSETPETLKPLWENAPENTFCLSLVAVTIGPAVERKIEESAQTNGGLRPAILDSAAVEALEQSLSFVTRLLLEESKAEGCELSPLLPCEKSCLKDVLAFLDSPKSEIQSGPEGDMDPLYSSVCYCFWNPAAKGKHAKAR